ncbi:MAG: hypothetical protein F2528_00810 [Actinobacteria bacterium]|uniref:Unannotated protein n=1 Tax=freshwater metagenome TaxID=449393 RepID=A0A6J6B323_9ZZZZ|nr:hypothetical protein [Actinomycetota bacterium]MTA24484.1 hypothetical protein [Actinomycetota bacterium]
MRKSFLSIATVLSLIASSNIAFADAAKPGQSMTHMKTLAGISSTLEGQGILLYVQGGATSAVIGESLGSADGQVVFHIPITGTKSGVEHIGSNIVFFNSANNKQVQLKNPLIDLSKGTISAVIPQGSGEVTTVLQITNASTLTPVVTKDRKVSLKTTAYKGVALSLAPGIGAALSSLLGLAEGSIPDNLAFATADVTLYSKLKAKK